MAYQFVNPARLAARIPNSTLEESELEALVDEASRYVQDGLPNYHTFPDWNATPATPASIAAAALDYAVFLAVGDEGTDSEQLESTAPESRRERCDRVIRALRSGSRVVTRAAISAEALEFGTDPNFPHWHYFAQTGVEVAPDTIELAPRGDGRAWILEQDYTVGYSAGIRRWYLERFTTDIEDGVAVSYEISWLRRREQETPAPRFGTIRVIRG